MAKTTLTTPIGLGAQAAKYTLLNARFDFEAERVEMVIAYFDTDDKRIASEALTVTFADLTFNPGSITLKLTNHLRSKGKVN